MREEKEGIDGFIRYEVLKTKHVGITNALKFDQIDNII